MYPSLSSIIITIQKVTNNAKKMIKLIDIIDYEQKDYILITFQITAFLIVIRGKLMTTHTVRFLMRAEEKPVLVAVKSYFTSKHLSVLRENREQNFASFEGNSGVLFGVDLGKVVIQLWIFRRPQDAFLEIRLLFDFPKTKNIEGYENTINEEVKHIKKYVETRISEMDDSSENGFQDETQPFLEPQGKIVSPWCPYCHHYKGKEQICPHCNRHVY